MAQGVDLGIHGGRLGRYRTITDGPGIIDCVNSGDLDLVLIVTVAGTLPPILAQLIGKWVETRNGRKTRLKIGDIEIEARTPKEVEQMLEVARKHERPPKSVIVKLTDTHE